MTKKIIGYAMIAIPFVGLFVLIAMILGLLPAVAIFAGSALFTVWIIKGVELSL